jgi:hypothetical protein
MGGSPCCRPSPPVPRTNLARGSVPPMSGQSIEEEIAPPPWPLHDQLVKLQSYSAEEIVGLTRMGAGMTFAGAELQVAEITRMVDDVRLDWPRLSPTRQGEIGGHVNTVISVVDQMLIMDSSHINTADQTSNVSADQVRAHREQLVASLGAELTWFLENVRPVSVMARAKAQPEEVVSSMSTTITEPDLNELKQTFAELRDQAADFERMRPVVEAATGATRRVRHSEAVSRLRRGADRA